MTDLTNDKHDQPQSGLGQGNTRQTNIKSARLEVIATAVDSINLSEPSSPYHSIYPYNKVDQTLSGHLREVDDTPGAERIMEMHKSGTFYEIHPDGTKVTKVFGDGFEISLENRNIVVGSNWNVTVQGDAAILIKGNCKQKIGGNLETTVLGDMITRVSGSRLDYTVGSHDIQTRQNFNLRAGLNIEFRALASFILKTGQAIITRAGSTARFFSKGRTWIDGSRVDLNLPGSDPGKPTLVDKDRGAGISISDNIVQPSISQQMFSRTDSEELGNTLGEDVTTYPKDRTKIID